MKTYKYRILMKDTVNGKAFLFAQYYTGMGIVTVCRLAGVEYGPQVEIVNVRKV